MRLHRIRAPVALVFALILALALALCVPDAPADAQTIHGTVRDTLGHAPVAGAVVTLLDSAGIAIGRAISNEHGTYGVRAVRAARTMRVVRIGFQPRDTSLAGHDDRRPVDVELSRFTTTLRSIRIADRSNCPRRADQDKAFAFWEQARAGLLNAVVAREMNPMSIRRFGYERTMDGNSSDVTRLLVWKDSATNSTTSFNAVHSARDFVRSGFTSDSAGTMVVYGPDADVLLDDAFATGYCFRIADPVRTRPRQVGLSFSAPDRRAGRVDIDGTLWLDTAARTIRDLDFRFIGLPRSEEGFRPGGTISFHTSANGVVFIDRWMLRRVDATLDTIIGTTGSLAVSDFLYATENGGELAQATWPGGETWHGSLGALRVHAVTSAHRPAVGAIITLPGTPYAAAADSGGTIAIDDLVPGPYALKIVDPRIAPLGFALPTAIRFTAVRDSTYHASLTVPTAKDYVTSLCLRDHQWHVNDSTFILGRLLAPDGKSVADAKVTFATLITDGSWSWIPMYYKTGTDGIFHLCSGAFVPGATILVRIARAGVPELDITRVIATNFTVMKITVPSPIKP